MSSAETMIYQVAPDYVYILQRPDDSCLCLDVDGPRDEPIEYLKQIRKEGFRFVLERQFGDHKLRFFRREVTQATPFGMAIKTDPATGRKTIVG